MLLLLLILKRVFTLKKEEIEIIEMDCDQIKFGDATTYLSNIKHEKFSILYNDNVKQNFMNAIDHILSLNPNKIKLIIAINLYTSYQVANFEKDTWKKLEGSNWQVSKNKNWKTEKGESLEIKAKVIHIQKRLRSSSKKNYILAKR